MLEGNQWSYNIGISWFGFLGLMHESYKCDYDWFTFNRLLRCWEYMEKDPITKKFMEFDPVEYLKTKAIIDAWVDDSTNKIKAVLKEGK
jgi:hypothetical protein